MIYDITILTDTLFWSFLGPGTDCWVEQEVVGTGQKFYFHARQQ